MSERKTIAKPSVCLSREAAEKCRPFTILTNVFMPLQRQHGVTPRRETGGDDRRASVSLPSDELLLEQIQNSVDLNSAVAEGESGRK